jgi:hypothetical protein
VAREWRAAARQDDGDRKGVQPRERRSIRLNIDLTDRPAAEARVRPGVVDEVVRREEKTLPLHEQARERSTVTGAENRGRDEAPELDPFAIP